MNKTAQFLSFALHPVLMPLYAVFLMLQSLTFKLNPTAQLLIYALVFLNTCLLPVFSAFVLKKIGLISSMYMPLRAERSVPYFITVLYYGFTWWLLYKAPVPPILAQLMMGAAIAVLGTALVNFKYKISAHLVGIGGLSGCFLVLGLHGSQDYTLPFIIGILSSGILGWARLQLSAHSPVEVYSGFLLGLLSQFIAVIIFR